MPGGYRARPGRTIKSCVPRSVCPPIRGEKGGCLIGGVLGLVIGILGAALIALVIVAIVAGLVGYGIASGGG
jgi:hypothetical protein